MKKLLNGFLTAALALVVLAVGVVAYKSRGEASALVCGVEQISVNFEGEQSLANILAEHQPDVSVGSVAHKMGYEPTEILTASKQGLCITVGKKWAKAAKSNDKVAATSSSNTAESTTSKSDSDSAAVASSGN